MDKRPDMYANEITISVSNNEAVMVFRRNVPKFDANKNAVGAQIEEVQIIQMPIQMAVEIRNILSTCLAQAGVN
jgi:hypothetical protein